MYRLKRSPCRRFAHLTWALLTACAGGGAGLLTPHPEPASSASTMARSFPLKLTYAYGTTALERAQAAKARSLEGSSYTGYTSTALPVSISLNVTRLGGTTTNTLGSCTAAPDGTSGTCTVTVTTVPGAATIAGTLTEGGAVIATFSKLMIIQPSTLNSIAFTANPVVASVNVQLAPSTINAGTANSVLVTVNAYDANNNVIAGTTPYVDVNGNPVTLSLNVQNSQAGGKGTVNFQGPMLISAPNQTPTYLQYDGRWMDQATITVASSSSALTNLTGNTLIINPFAAEYSTPSGAMYLTSGPDGNIWMTEWPGTGFGKVALDGTYTHYPCAACSATHGITVGPDGKIWFVEAAGEIGNITTSGVPTRLAALPGGVMLVAGPDGNLWAATNNASICKVTTTGVVTNFVIGSQTRGITVGPDGYIWYSNPSSHTVDPVSLSGTLLASYSIPALTGSTDGLIAGPDGNIWLGNQGSNLIYRVTPSGTITTFTLQVGANPRDLVVGPDGYIWFTEQGTNTIGRLSTSGALTEYGAANGISGGSSPVGIAVGADGNIWFTESGLKRVAKFVL